jgi:hypothetical protein
MFAQVKSIIDARIRRASEKAAAEHTAAAPSYDRAASEADYARNFEEGYKEGYSKSFSEAEAAGMADGHAKGFAEGFDKGFKAEHDRLAAIFRSDAATGRSKLTRHLAFDTDMAADKAIDLLSASPREEAAVAAASSGLLAEMAALSHPNIGGSPLPAGGNGPVLTKFEEGQAAARAVLGK